MPLCVCVSICLPAVLPLSHEVVLYTQEDVVQRVQQLTEGKGVKVVFDGGALTVQRLCVCVLSALQQPLSFGNCVCWCC